MPNVKPKGWINPRAWKPLQDPDCPVLGYVYRATTDGTTVLIQRKKWNHGDEFRTMKRLTFEGWREINMTLENAENAEKADVASVLARIAKGTYK